MKDDDDSEPIEHTDEPQERFRIVGADTISDRPNKSVDWLLPDA